MFCRTRGWETVRLVLLYAGPKVGTKDDSDLPRGINTGRIEFLWSKGAFTT